MTFLDDLGGFGRVLVNLDGFLMISDDLGGFRRVLVDLDWFLMIWEVLGGFGNLSGGGRSAGIIMWCFFFVVFVGGTTNRVPTS